VEGKRKHQKLYENIRYGLTQTSTKISFLKGKKEHVSDSKKTCFFLAQPFVIPTSFRLPKREKKCTFSFCSFIIIDITKKKQTDCAVASLLLLPKKI
jgi:hypothetical protein